MRILLLLIATPLTAGNFSEYIPRSLCSEKLSDIATISTLTLPLSFSGALLGEALGSPYLPMLWAATHSALTLGLWSALKLGKKSGFRHDHAKYTKKAPASSISGTKNVSFIDDTQPYMHNDLKIPNESEGLVPNDIRVYSPQGTWQRNRGVLNFNTITLVKDPDPEIFIRKALRFVPKNLADNKGKDSGIVFVVTHGTFGSQTPSYYKDYAEKPLDTAISPQNFRHIQRFATRYATQKKKPLTLLSFRWSGDLDNNERLAAGKFLAGVLNEHFASNTIILLGHSHGCNVHRHATQHLEEPVSLMINIAPPYRSENEYRPKNGAITHALSFMSPHDIIALGGQVPESTIPLLPLALKTAVTIGASMLFDHSYGRALRMCMLGALWLPCIIQAAPYVIRSPLDAPQEAADDVRIVPIIDGSYLGHSQMADISKYLWYLHSLNSSQKQPLGLSKLVFKINTSEESYTVKKLENDTN